MLHKKGELPAGNGNPAQGKLLGDPERISRISDIMRRGHFGERRDAVLELRGMAGNGAIEAREATRILISAVHDEDKQVRISALLTLSELGTGGLPGLGEGLSDGEAGIRNFSAELINRVLRGTPDVSLIEDYPIEHLIDRLLRALCIAGTGTFANSALLAMADKMPVALLGRIDAFRGSEAVSEGGMPERLRLLEDAARHTLSAMAGDRC